MRMRADGNYPFTLVNGKYVTEEKRNNSGIYSWQGEATFYHTFKDDIELDVKGYYFYSRRGLPALRSYILPTAQARRYA